MKSTEAGWQLNCLLFWVESVAQVRRIIVQIRLKFSAFINTN